MLMAFPLKKKPRSEIDALHSQYGGQLADWRARCEAAEAKHAAANIQVDIIIITKMVTMVVMMMVMMMVMVMVIKD